MRASEEGRVLFFCALVCALPAYGQNYPTRPIRLVTSSAGGSSDFAARLIAQGLSASLGQQVIVDNRGAGAVPVEIVVKAPADGYTLLYYGSTLWLLPIMQQTSYDALRDFTPVTMALNSPTIVAVHPSLAVASIKELIAFARAKPGVLNYGAASAGSPTHLAGELFKSVAGIDMVGIPFKGSGPALNAAIAGEVQVLLAPTGGIAPHINSGRLRALAVASTKRSPSFPNLPTVAEGGLPGYEYGQFSGIFAPAKTPAAVLEKLYRETVKVINRPDVKEKFANTGTDVEGSTPQEAVAKIKGEVTRLGKIIRDLKIRAD